jgi:hypothetical protein
MVTKLPLIVLGRSMTGTEDRITFEVEAETGDRFEISFSLRGILTTVVMSRNWTPLNEALAELPPSGARHGP